MAYSVPLFDLNYGAAEEQAVLAVLRSKWISMGPQAAELEKSFAAHLGVRHAVALTNCTAALHLAIEALGIGAGDEVIVPSLTFVATVNCIGAAGAKPVFADITSPDDFSVDPGHVRRLIGARTKAIMAMHFAGFPCDMDTLVALAREHNLALVEDAAHAPDTRYNGRCAGTFGDIGCFSFYANKNIACGEGGLLVTDRDDIAASVRLMRSHGMTSLSFDRARGHASSYDVVARGYNLRLDDIRASLALAQFNKLQEDTARRAALRQQYIERLRSIADISVPYATCPHRSSHHILPVLLKEGGSTRREVVRAALAQRGIQTSVHYPAAHRFSIYESNGASLPLTEHVTDHVITLPLYATLTEPMIERVVKELAEALSS
jgi:dTDP-4-amino-4,6-dideoxygalactose transaminase